MTVIRKKNAENLNLKSFNRVKLTKVMQVLKLCKLANKPCPGYYLGMNFLFCAISKQFKAAQLNFYIQMYFIESFSANKILNNIKINEIY